MRETRVRFLSWEDPLEKEMATHCSTLVVLLPGKSHGQRSLVGYRRAGYIYIYIYIYIYGSLGRNTSNWPKEVLVVAFQNPLGGFKNIQALHCRPFKCSFWGWGSDILVEVCFFCFFFFFFSLKWFPRVARIENPFNHSEEVAKGDLWATSDRR